MILPLVRKPVIFAPALFLPGDKGEIRRTGRLGRAVHALPRARSALSFRTDNDRRRIVRSACRIQMAECEQCKSKVFAQSSETLTDAHIRELMETNPARYLI